MPTEKIQFSKRVLERITPPAKNRVWYRDAGCPGLWAAVFYSGTVVFYRYSKIANRPERLRIGRLGEISVEEARRECIRLGGAIAAGVNVAAEKRAARRLPLFGELADRYLEQPNRSGRDRQERRPATLAKYRSFLANGLADWRLKPLASITRGAVEELITRLAGTKRTANGILKFVRAVLEYAVELEMLPANPATRVKAFATQSRGRYLSQDELGRLLTAADNAGDPIADLTRLAILTAARRSNVVQMRWCDINLDESRWRLSADQMKANKAHDIPLAASAVEILRRRLETRSNDYVFPGRGSRPIAFPFRQWESVLESAGLDDFRFHDLRRTAATIASGKGTPITAVSRLLHHSQLATTSVYAKGADESTRQAVEAIAAYVAASKRSP
jgi:integrase